MKINLVDKLTPEEINELQKRAYSFAEQMFFSGLSTGRELNREPLQEKTEKYIRDRLSYMTSYFIRDDVWEIMPPQGYNPNPNIEVPEFNISESEFKGDVEKMMGMAKDTVGVIAETADNNRPDWSKDELKPSWADDKRPFK